MHPALILLLQLRFQGAIRRLIRSLKTPRKAVFILAAVLYFGLIMMPMFFTSRGSRPDLEMMGMVIPSILMFITLISVFTSAADKVVHFHPQEIDFLFSAPFPRRHLLTYKIIGGMGGALFTSFIFSIVFTRAATSWSRAFLGFFLSLSFVQFSAMVSVLMRQSAAERIYTPLRKTVFGGLLLLVALGIWQALPKELRWPTLEELRNFYYSTPMRILLAPFQVYAKTILAANWYPTFFFWGSLGMAINLGLYALIVRLDADYLETAMNISNKMYERIRRVRSGGSMFDLKKSLTLKWKFPTPPWMGGCGPICWRQLVTAVRNIKNLLLFLLTFGIGMGPALLAMGGKHEELIFVALGILAWMTVILAVSLRFDFRADLDHIAWMKALPIHSMAAALGEMAAPVLILSLIDILALISFVIAFKSLNYVFWGFVFCSIPYNLLVIGVQNLVFLLFPTRMIQASPGDLQQFGRQMATFFLMVLLLLVSLGLSAGLGWLAYWLLGGSKMAFLMIFTLALYGMSAVIVPYVAWAYDRFDVGEDLPA